MSDFATQLTDLHLPLGMNGASTERSNLLQIISPKGEPMNEVEYLLEQAARAERLARSILDTVTVERLQAFAAECRTQVKILNKRGLEAA